MTIEYLELSPSNKARCKVCKKLIGLKTPRGVSIYRGGNYTSAVYYCYKCAEKELNAEISYAKKLKKELKELVKKNKKAVVLMGLEKENE